MQIVIVVRLHTWICYHSFSDLGRLSCVRFSCSEAIRISFEMAGSYYMDSVDRTIQSIFSSPLLFLSLFATLLTNMFFILFFSTTVHFIAIDDSDFIS